jgi:SAM-dependent methyltransferase
MHESSMDLMREFVAMGYVKQGARVLDVGSMNVNGSYKDLLPKGVDYVGLDMEEGDGVDIVPADPYAWPELDDKSFDCVISGQAFEHIEYPWLTIVEICRVLKPGGYCCIIAPSGGPEHRYPVDCYRYYPDGMVALAKWTGLEVVEATYSKANSWGDCRLIAKRRP